MPQLSITQLPTARTLTGSEPVPIVQNGVTVQTTTGAIAGAAALNYPFVTFGSTAGLTQARQLTSSAGITLSDGGVGGNLQITLNGAALSLDLSPIGIQVKTGPNTVTGRQISVGSGLGISNADGTTGDPLITLAGVMSNIASVTGTGLLAISGTLATTTAITGTYQQIVVVNGDAGAGAPTISLALNPVIPGVESVTIPGGTTAQRPVGVNGMLRYDSDLAQFSGYAGGVWRQFSLTGGVSLINTGTGLTGGPITTTGTISLADTAVTPGTYTNTNLTVDAQGRITSASNGSAGGVTSITGTANEITATGTTAVTLSLPNALTFTNKTVTGGSFVDPIVKNNFKFEDTGIVPYTQFAGALGSWVSNTNNFQEVYSLNQNNGSDASSDWVAYNDASDINSYFIDMGINSSNFSSATYPIFSANSGYVFTGGGSSGQASDFFLGTSNAASDLIFFTGDVTSAAIRARFKGNTGNLLIGSNSDTGEKFQLTGTAKLNGATTFGSTVTLNANPSLALQAATKQYVDDSVATGFTVHPSVVYATAAALPANTYNNGASGVGATLTAVANGILSVDGNVVVAGQRILVKNQVASSNNGCYTVTVVGTVATPYILTRSTDFDVAGAGEIANNAYFFVTAGATNAGSSYILSQTAAITVGTTSLPFTLFANQLVYTGGTNITVAGQVINLSGTVAATNGGTGTATVTTGDLLYGSGTNTWSKLALGIAYKSLVVNASGTQLEWNAVALNQTAAVSGQLGVPNGGTGLSTVTTGQIPYGNGTGALSTSANLTFSGANLAVSGNVTATNHLGATFNTTVSPASQTGAQSGGTLQLTGAAFSNAAAGINSGRVLVTGGASTAPANVAGGPVVLVGGTSQNQAGGSVTIQGGVGYTAGGSISIVSGIDDGALPGNSGAVDIRTGISSIGGGILTLGAAGYTAFTLNGNNGVLALSSPGGLGTINNMSIGATTASTGKFTTVTATTGIFGGTF